MDRPVLVRSGLCEKAIPSPSSEPGSSSSDPSSFGTSESIADPYSSVFDNVKLSLNIPIRKSRSKIYFGQVKQSKNTISRYDDTLVRKFLNTRTSPLLLIQSFTQTFILFGCVKKYNTKIPFRIKFRS